MTDSTHAERGLRLVDSHLHLDMAQVAVTG
jgi:hypothetical protein